MKCYLHIGTEKTGSSYLQSIAAINRDVLCDHGIWYPFGGKREQDMLNGRISPGNAQVLSNLLDSPKGDQVEGLISKWVKEAKEKGCKKLLLSNELLALKFSKPGTWSFFIEVAKICGISNVNYLLILRDPVDLALSLYKHRAKRGTSPAIEDWVTTNFEYGSSLKEFFKNVTQFKPNLTSRKYLTKDGYLEKIFFRDWLGLTHSFQGIEEVVNPSLSFSELLLIKSLRSQDAFLPEFLYEKLLKISKKNKAQEPRLESFYRSVIDKILTRYDSTWKECQAALLDDEQLTLPGLEPEVDEANNVITLSPHQIDAISTIIKDSTSFSFRWKIRKIKTYRAMGQIKHKIITVLGGKK